jgi:hypothetical protein
LPVGWNLVEVSAGGYPGECSWSINCTDGFALSLPRSLAAPYSAELPLTSGATCTLDLYDSYGDGWNGADWTGFGQSHTISSGGSSNTGISFIVPPAPTTSSFCANENEVCSSCSGSIMYGTGSSFSEVQGNTHVTFNAGSTPQDVMCNNTLDPSGTLPSSPPPKVCYCYTAGGLY